MDNEASNKKSILAEIKNFKSKSDFDGMIVAAKNGLKAFPADKKLMHYLSYAQAHYVNEKLHSKVVTELEKKGDYETLSQVYSKLLNVFPGHPHLLRLLRGVEKKINTAHSREQKKYFDEARMKIKDLLKKSMEDEAISVCYEVLEYAPQNKEFQKLLKKAKNRRDKEMNKDLSKLFSAKGEQLKAEFRSNKKAFIRV